MRGFSFGKSLEEDPEQTWYLHLICPWRLESPGSVLTGSADWYEPEDSSADTAQWDPYAGGSLQEATLRGLFEDPPNSSRSLVNRTDRWLVEDVVVNKRGDITLTFDVGVVLSAWPSGSTGMFWCLFRKDREWLSWDFAPAGRVDQESPGQSVL